MAGFVIVEAYILTLMVIVPFIVFVASIVFEQSNS
jgi:hypothetical protein